jgi:uncharacterized protein (TIRG00374 family)
MQTDVKAILYKSMMGVIKKFLGSAYFRLGLSLTISTVSLYLAIRLVSWEEMWKVFTQAKWGWAVIAVLSVVANVLVKIGRWWLLSVTTNKPVGFSRLTKAFLAGQLLNSIYPGRLGDLSRAFVTGGRADERAFMLGTIVLEKVLDIIAFTLLTIGMVLLVPMPGWINGSVVGVGLMGLVVVMTLGVIWRLRRDDVKMPNWLRGWIKRVTANKLGVKLVDWVKMGSESLEVLGKRRLLVGVVGCTMIVWATALLTNLLVMQSFYLGLDAPGEQLRASMLILVGLTAGIKIPAPLQIGVFEYICILSLSFFNVPQAIALSYGLLLHAVVFLPQTLGGLVSLAGLGLRGKG